MAGFEVSAGGEERIKLVAEKGGVEYTLFHVLRQPTASELRTYSKRRSEVNVRRRGKVSMKNSPAEIDEWLWNQVAVNVEGYTINGLPLDAEQPDWKDHVPLLHKVEAVTALSDVAVDDEEGPVKNSRQPSAES
ncbi:hypothetical protein MYX64_06355 [Nitrospinae bacterium AH_259_B05_G02_I21]|nr:hypothetical protein [Nitrospinae bacterium AH_259_B05_G02_I21]